MSMPDDFQAEHDLQVLDMADRIVQDKGRVAKAARFAEQRAEELRAQADRISGREVKKAFNGSPRESSFKRKGG